MSANQDLLRLRQAASASGVEESRLRLWCATGLLACERSGLDWMISSDCLGEIRRLARDRGRHRAARDARQVAVAAMFGSSERAAEVLQGLARDGIETLDANTAPMALDQVDAVLLAVTVDASHADAVVEIVEARGGTVIAELQADARGG